MIEYPEYTSPSELAQLVLALHTPVLRTDASELTRRIHLYPQYQLGTVDLIELAVRFDNWSKDQRVLQYAELGVATLPPIVLGCMYADKRYEVVDGLHRAVAAKQRGESSILVYFPVMNTETLHSQA